MHFVVIVPRLCCKYHSAALGIASGWVACHAILRADELCRRHDISASKKARGQMMLLPNIASTEMKERLRRSRGRVVPRFLRPALLVLLTISLVPILGACDPVTALTLGAVLNKNLQQVQVIASSATAGANGLLLNASGQVQLAIQNAQSAYGDSLDQTVDSLDQLTTKKLQELESAVIGLNSKVDAELRMVTDRAQILASTLPFANNQPKVGSYGPHFAVSAISGKSGVSPLELKVEGHFADVKSADLAPTLTVGSRTLKPETATDLVLLFHIPRELMPYVTTGMTSVNMKLAVPYQVKEWILFNSRKVADYTLSVTVVQPTPGQMQLVTYTSIPQSSTKHVRVDYPNEVSSKSGEPQDQPLIVYPDKDQATERMWTVYPETVRCEKTWSEGQDDVQGVHVESLNPPACHAWTRSGGVFYANGRIRFRIEFDEWLAIDPRRQPDPPRMLSEGWGETLPVRVMPGQWELSYVTIDGKSQTISDQNAPYSDRFVTVTVKGNGIAITAKDLEQVIW